MHHNGKVTQVYGDQEDKTLITVMLDTMPPLLKWMLIEEQTDGGERKDVKLVIGLLFTGKHPSTTIELLPILEHNQVVNQPNSLLVLVKFSKVGILFLISLEKQTKQLLLLHHILHGEMLSLQHQLVENQSHSVQILLSILKYLNAKEPQHGLLKLNNQDKQNFSQEDASIYILMKVRTHIMTSFYQLKMKIGNDGGQQDTLSLNTKSITIMLKHGSGMKKLVPSTITITQIISFKTIMENFKLVKLVNQEKVVILIQKLINGSGMVLKNNWKQKLEIILMLLVFSIHQKKTSTSKSVSIA